MVGRRRGVICSIGDLAMGEATRGWKNVRLGIAAVLLDFEQRCQGGEVLTTTNQ